MRVLVVEDDRDVREGLLDMLGNEGFEVAVAEEGAVALEMASATLPDAILLDALMQGMDGREFLEARRARPGLSEVPVILMTGLPTRIVEGLGVTAVLSKPFTREELLRALRRCAQAAAESRAERRSARGPVTELMAADHARLDALLARACAGPELDRAAFDLFRAGLLRHIGMEEKVLFPSLSAAQGAPLAESRRLRVDHGALASLLVPTPNLDIVGELRSILLPHNALEDGPGGVYERCDAALEGVSEDVLRRLSAYPEVKVARNYDGAGVYRTAREALAGSARQAERKHEVKG